METVQTPVEQVNKYSNYLIQNLVNIRKKNQINKLKIDIKEHEIIVCINNEKKIITNLVEYKSLIDELSMIYHVVLKYFPKYTNHFTNSTIIFK